VRSILLCS